MYLTPDTIAAKLIKAYKTLLLLPYKAKKNRIKSQRSKMKQQFLIIMNRWYTSQFSWPSILLAFSFWKCLLFLSDVNILCTVYWYRICVTLMSPVMLRYWNRPKGWSRCWNSMKCFPSTATYNPIQRVSL